MYPAFPQHWSSGAHSVESWQTLGTSMFWIFPFFLFWFNLVWLHICVIMRNPFSAICLHNISQWRQARHSMINNVLKILPSLVKMLSYVNSVSVFDRNCFVRNRRVSVTWKHYVLWKSNKRQTEAGSEMGLDKGKMSDRIQSGVFSVHSMSRCRELACTPTATVGFHKESVSIQALIHAAEGPGIVTLHAKFQLVLVPVVSLEGGCHISETSMATFRVRLRQKCHCFA